MRKKNILLIGAGPHARRIHIPIINQEKNNTNAKIKCVIDLEDQKDVILSYIKQHQLDIDECVFLNDDKAKIHNNKLNKETQRLLDNLKEKYDINAVFISTEPTAHVAYANWALKNGISVLMDKPISAPSDLSSSKKSIQRLSKDYHDLIELYQRQKQIYPSLVFELLTQRRYHFAFWKIRDLVNEVKERTGVPITSFQATHCDGQWRMPKEIIEQNYHPYNQGYGKLLHSGYHAIDILDWLVRGSTNSNSQRIHKLEVTSNFVRPNDFLVQLPFSKYHELFNSEQAYYGYTENEYENKFAQFGELDSQIQVAYKNSKNRTVTIGQFNLIHNSFSQRNWPSATGRDLYKGNGRIRHELHYIVQGPFQTIIYESLQSEEILNKNTNHSKVGGEYHLDIHVFRNSKMFKDWKSYQKYSFDDFDTYFLKGYSRGHQEDARRECILRFLASLDNRATRRYSDIEDQSNSIKIIEAAYMSMYNKKHKKNPLITFSGE